MEKILTVGIPAYNAHSTIRNVLSSVQIQSIKDNITVIIGNDNPETNYDEIISCYPDLDIQTVTVEKNGGPGIARKICLDNCKTPYITFIDADDVFATPYSLEHLLAAINIKKDGIIGFVMSQGAFLQECDTPNGTQFLPRNDVGHPWVFGRLYNVDFLKKSDINFTSLRAMEDGEFNAKLRMLVEGTQFGINIIDEPVYYWKKGSEHSITRSHTKDKEIPIYNYGLCMLGSNKCFASALDFVSDKNPFNPSIKRTAVELMVNQYFTYYECLENYPEFADQNNWNAKWWYNNVYKKYAADIPYSVLESVFVPHPRMLQHEPEETFKQWFTRISSENFDESELSEIRAKLPDEILDLEKKSGCFESFKY